MKAVKQNTTLAICSAIVKQVSWCLCAGILFGCGSGSLKRGGSQDELSYVSKNTNSQNLSLNLEQLTRSINNNDWVLRSNCRGTDFSLDAHLQFDPQSGTLTLSAQGFGLTPSEIANTSPSLAATSGMSLKLKGSLEKQSANVTMKGKLNDDSSVVFSGIYSKANEHIVGTVKSKKFTNCSSFHLLHKQNYPSFESNQFELPDVHASSVKTNKKLRFLVKSACDKSMLQWLEFYLNKLPAQRRFGFSYKPYVLEMYSDNVFLNYFPQSIAHYSSEQLREFSSQISQSAECPKLSEAARHAWRAVSHLTHPLNNIEKHSYNELLLDRSALTLYQEWLRKVDSSIAEISHLTNATSRESLVALYSFETTLKAFENRFPSSVFDKLDTTETLKTIARERRKFEIANFEQDLEQRLSKRSADVEQLIELSEFPSRYADYIDKIAPDKKESVQQSINSYLAQNTTSALSTFIKQRDGINGIEELGVWRKKYADLVKFMSPGESALIEGEANRRREEIVNNLLAKARAEWQQSVLSLGKGLNALQEAIEFERKINSELVLVRQHERIQAFELERAEFRQQLLNIHAEQLLKKIEETDSMAQLNALQLQYFWSNDAQSAIVRRMRSGITFKKRQFLPLEPGKGNDYLNAIYGEDFTTLQKLDKAYNSQLRSKSTLREYDSEVLIPWHRSLLPIVIASYLVDYQYRYKSCLTQHSVPHKSSAVSQLIYDHSWSDSQYLGPNPEQIEYFTVKEEFSFIYNALGLTSNDSFYASELGKLYANKNALPTILSRSTRRMMSDYDCRSLFVERMEQGMMKYFKFLERQK